MSVEQVYLSTVAFRATKVEVIIEMAVRNNWGIEFSSGMPFHPDMQAVFIQANSLRRLPHNYFPAPAQAFVLNLASSDDRIRSASVEMCLNGLFLAKTASAPFFSAHAGFCVDPQPSELGKPLNRVGRFDRGMHWTIFLQSLRQILDKAEDLGVDFLIENNVLARMNVYEDGSNPLFCCDAPECLKLIQEINHPRLGLLLDTGHWKVSSNTLDFPLEDVNRLKAFVRGVHHSDNDGVFDTNDKLGDDYWFLKYPLEYRNCVHVLEVKDLSETEAAKQLDLLIKTFV